MYLSTIFFILLKFFPEALNSRISKQQAKKTTDGIRGILRRRARWKEEKTGENICEKAHTSIYFQ